MSLLPPSSRRTIASPHVFPPVAAQPGTDAIRPGADSVDQAKPAVGQADQARRVPLAGVRLGRG